ncbi:MAG: PIN domain nuclease [Nocardioides sp.]
MAPAPQPARWLIDKSALWRLPYREVAEALQPRVTAGLVGISILTELKIGFSAQSTLDYRRTRRDYVERLIPIMIPARAEARAREVQSRLVDRGQHRAVGVPDLLIAATAELEGLAVLHYDADFDLIAEITGQECEWIVPRGSLT